MAKKNNIQRHEAYEKIFETMVRVYKKYSSDEVIQKSIVQINGADVEIGDDIEVIDGQAIT